MVKSKMQSIFLNNFYNIFQFGIENIKKNFNIGIESGSFEEKFKLTEMKGNLFLEIDIYILDLNIPPGMRTFIVIMSNGRVYIFFKILKNN